MGCKRGSCKEHEENMSRRYKRAQVSFTSQSCFFFISPWPFLLKDNIGRLLLSILDVDGFSDNYSVCEKIFLGFFSFNYRLKPVAVITYVQRMWSTNMYVSECLSKQRPWFKVDSQIYNSGRKSPMSSENKYTATFKL